MSEKPILILFFEDNWAECVKMIQRVTGRLDEQKFVVRTPKTGILDVTFRETYVENKLTKVKETKYDIRFHVSAVREEFPYKEKFYLLEGSKYDKDFLKKYKKQILGMMKYNKVQLIEMQLIPTA